MHEYGTLRSGKVERDEARLRAQRNIQMYPPNLKLPHGGRRVCTISINKVNPSCMYYSSHLVGGLGVYVTSRNSAILRRLPLMDVHGGFYR